MKKAPLGELEGEALAFLTQQGPLSAREIATRFGEPRGLARTTVLTVLDRLCKKGYLTREKHDGVFRYAASQPETAVLRDLVKQFVQRTLGGAISPFFAYLSEARNLSPDEVAALRKLIDTVDAQTDKDEGSEPK